MKRVYIQVGEVASRSSDRTYAIKEDLQGNLSCGCMSWRFQKKPVEERSCKHTEEFLRRRAVV